MLTDACDPRAAAPQAGDLVPGDGPPELTMTDGEGSPISRKACYLLRSTRPGAGVDPSKVRRSALAAPRAAGARARVCAACLCSCCRPLRGCGLEFACCSRARAAAAPVQSCDADLLFGEVSASPLHTLEALLSKLYQPLFHSRDQWGKAEDAQVREFRANLDKFVDDVDDALKSLVGGLELRKPDKRYDLDAARTARALRDDEMIAHFEGAS